jgi:hypothetical protein
MTTVVAVFGDSNQALNAIEALRGATLNVDTLRLVGRPDDAAELSSATGAGASVATGPTAAVVDGWLDSELSPSDLREVHKRVEGGGVVVLADELDADAANALAQHLRDYKPDNVIVTGAASKNSNP